MRQDDAVIAAFWFQLSSYTAPLSMVVIQRMIKHVIQLKSILHSIAILISLSGAWGCSEMSGKVVDSTTNTPLPDAVILVEWTMTSGLGLTSTGPYKVSETRTDQYGHFQLSSVLNPFVNPPRITIYKEGYVAWNNEYIFPTWEKRKNINWLKDSTITLEPFRKEYSRGDHVYFLHNVTHWGKLIEQAFRWEELENERGNHR